MLPNKRFLEGYLKSASEMLQNIRENRIPAPESLPVPRSVAAGAWGDTPWHRHVMRGGTYITPNSKALEDRYTAQILEDPASAVQLLRQNHQQREPLAMDERLFAISVALVRVFVKDASKTVIEGTVSVLGRGQVPLIECLFDVLYEVIVEENFLLEFPVYTSHIVYTMTSILGQSHFTSQFSVYTLERGPALWKSLWNHRRCLARDAPIDPIIQQLRDGITELVLAFFMPCMTNFDVAKSEESRLPHLALLCWYYLPVESPRSGKTLMAAMHLVSFGSGWTLDQITMFIECAILDTMGPANFLKRMLLELERPGAAELDNLVTTVRAMSGFLTHDAFEKMFIPSGIYKALADVLVEFERTGDQSSESQWVILRDIFSFIEWVTVRCFIPFGVELWIRRYHVVRLLGRGARLCLKERCNSSFAILNIISAYSKVATTIKDLNTKPPKLLFEVLEKATQKEWYPTLKALWDEPRVPGMEAKYEEVVQAWHHFGISVGLKENEERQRYEAEVKEKMRFCSWKGCEFHRKMPTQPLRTCVGCSEARYCDRACQAKDWKEGGHKRRCKRLKGGVAHRCSAIILSVRCSSGL